MAALKLLRGTGGNLLLGGALFCGLSCGSDPNEPEPATSPTLRVSVTTSGPFPDADGYFISIDGMGFEPPWTLGPTDSRDIPNITPGYHTIQLIGLSPNCDVAGGDSRTLEIPGPVVIRLAYSVSCVRPSSFSTLIITTNSTGAGTDPDGYLVQIDGGAPQPIGVPGTQGTATLSVAGLAPGVHSVFLSGVASHCDVIFSENPVNVTIDAYPNAGATFIVSCGQNPPA
jgi:hypothetical protein